MILILHSKNIKHLQVFLLHDRHDHARPQVLNEFSSPAAASGYIVPSRLLSASTSQEDKIPIAPLFLLTLSHETHEFERHHCGITDLHSVVSVS
jgi:hypothetical protein